MSLFRKQSETEHDRHYRELQQANPLARRLNRSTKIVAYTTMAAMLAALISAVIPEEELVIFHIFKIIAGIGALTTIILLMAERYTVYTDMWKPTRKEDNVKKRKQP